MVPAYPDDPTKDTRLNLHIPAGAAWELKAVAAALRIEQRRLFRHLWETFRTTIEGKEALQQALDSAGIAITAGEGRQRFGEEPRAWAPTAVRASRGDVHDGSTDPTSINRGTAGRSTRRG